ncbi:MAG TPA: neutral/alkaline non-lysosomal ceramidase N-terminal domain-containing protein [Herpetosiphonaceae bacterium]
MRLQWLPRLVRLLLVPLLLVPLAFAGQTRAAPDESTYLIGAGVYDITGPAAEQGMMGYAMVGQKTAGIHIRLRSRAFAIAEPQAGGRRVVFASVDMGLMPQAVKQNVVARLRARYGALYGDDNVVLSATHTHGGPGGYSHYALYNITTLGYSPQTFEIVTSGIFQSIVRAHDNLAPGTISLAAGDLLNANANRSPEAYAMNPAAERAAYQSDTDKQMTVLRFQEQGGREAGVVSWFPVHATSMTNQNLLITGDNKGFASQLFERLKGTDYAAPKTFVAAFAQSNEGDVSPCPNSYGGAGCGSYDEFVSTALNGQRQHDKALALYNQAAAPLAGRIDYRHAYVNLAGLSVEPRFADGTARRTCVAAIGASFAAGAEDGPSNFPWITEGMKYQGLIVAEDQACHQPKPILLPTGRMQPYPWTPEVLPVQIVTIGRLALVAVPGEWTTMAGRRLRAAVAAELAPVGIDHVVIAGLANAYAGYVTTREEYQAQHYEGASTHFGPWTAAAFQQEFSKLAAALRAGTPVAAGPAPRDLSCCQTSLQTGVVFDDVPLFKQFGAVETDAAAAYQRGQTARVVFWGGHPKNNPQIQSTYLKVQRNVQGAWVTVASDWDSSTRYRWERNGVAYSKVTVEWAIPADAPAGSYRIVHDGHWKSGWTGAIKPYAGVSRVFAVQP